MRLAEAVTKVYTKLPVDQWVKPTRLVFQERIIDFLLRAYGFLLLTTMSIYFLQGFRLGKFWLSDSLLTWLAGATIGEIGGVLLLTFGAVFRRDR